MAASLKNRTFTTLADLNDGVLGDDYVHGALETWKLKGKTSNGGKWDYKAKIKHQQKDGQLTGSLSDEVKIQFPYDRYYFWFGTRRNGDLKLHADLGNVTVAGQELNLFTNLKTGINFKNFAFRFGANHFNGNLTTSTRLVAESNATCHTNTSITNRTFFRQGNLFYGLVTSFGLNEGVSLRQYDAVVGYEKDNTNVYVQHASNSKAAKLGLGTVTGTVTHSKGDQNFGVEVSQDFANNNLSAVIGASTRVGDATLKSKINKALDLEVSWKKQINKQLTVTTSGKLGLGNVSKAVDFSKYIPIPFGVQFEVNV